MILRAEAVESAQAGDKCDFIGTLIVVPDVSQIATAGMSAWDSCMLVYSLCSAVSVSGARAETSTKVRSREGFESDGVR